ncbi:hypothetical protein Mmc1_0936 [Magnetococcus marinus MC-1]|uniref:Uncharacterized protein n=1 Tax=Magnetococcus marinus (strain ATCC BAA-1437 / JCM 17883 / MC-1) TaxID=156889 RepID=A0L661_MAGMM|nr:hypothetical protein [Magnetococcus marinus]ABK43454.1 hypothetical protein Mmc1_0936 [Magnetococcus marinus MC-1]
MKSKLLGLIASSVLGLAIAYTGYDLYMSQSLPGGLFSPYSAARNAKQENSFGKLPKPDAGLDVMRENNEPLLRQLRSPRGRESGKINMAMLGYSKDSIMQSRENMQALGEDFRKRIISMTFVTGEDRYAVIDGVLYKEGDTFEDGAKIRTIRPDKVLIAGRETLQWVEVFNPVEVKRKEKLKPAEATSAAAPVDPAAAAALQTPAAAADQKKALGVGNILDSLKMIQNYKGMLERM